MKLLVTLYIFIFFQSAFSAVWESSGQWTEERELEYSEWIASTVERDIFSSPESPYYDIKTDCADYIYALRIIFAYENGLPFTMNAPVPMRPFSVTNESSDFDHLPAESRLKAFINYIGDSVGTYALAHSDTYSINPSEIRSGDIFIYTDNTVTPVSNHSYIVKSIRADGNLVLYYSTVPKKRRKTMVHIGFPARATIGAPWGLKRFKNQFLPSSNDQLQYDLIDEHGEDGAMREIKRIIATEKETRESIVVRRMHNACMRMDARVDAVQDAEEHFERFGYKCLNSSLYDNYSSPSRDKILYESIFSLAKFWRRMLKHDAELEVADTDLRLALDYLVGVEISRRGKKALQSYCQSNFDIDSVAPIDMRKYLLRYKKGMISSDPHSSKYKRWGAKDRPYLSFGKINYCVK